MILTYSQLDWPDNGNPKQRRLKVGVKFSKLVFELCLSVYAFMVKHYNTTITSCKTTHQHILQ